jgi:hypothetical protein
MVAPSLLSGVKSPTIAVPAEVGPFTVSVYVGMTAVSLKVAALKKPPASVASTVCKPPFENKGTIKLLVAKVPVGDVVTALGLVGIVVPSYVRVIAELLENPVPFTVTELPIEPLAGLSAIAVVPGIAIIGVSCEIDIVCEGLVDPLDCQCSNGVLRAGRIDDHVWLAVIDIKVYMRISRIYDICFLKKHKKHSYDAVTLRVKRDYDCFAGGSWRGSDYGHVYRGRLAKSDSIAHHKCERIISAKPVSRKYNGNSSADRQ